MPLQAIICDFSGVILLPKHDIDGQSLTAYYHQISKEPGFDFNQHFEFNLELIDYFKKSLGHLDLSLFSSSDLYGLSESAHMIGSVFDQIFTPEGLGFSKTEPEAYEAMSNVLEIDPEKILFIDDEPDHVKAALQADLQGAHFHNTPKLLVYLGTIV